MLRRVRWSFSVGFLLVNMKYHLFFIEILHSGILTNAMLHRQIYPSILMFFHPSMHCMWNSLLYTMILPVYHRANTFTPTSDFQFTWPVHFWTVRGNSTRKPMQTHASQNDGFYQSRAICHLKGSQKMYIKVLSQFLCDSKAEQVRFHLFYYLTYLSNLLVLRFGLEILMSFSKI